MELDEGWVACIITMCRECESYDVKRRENERGDCEFECNCCGHEWWIDGPDY